MDSHNAISQAKKAASENDFASAQKILKQVLTKEPKNIEAWLALSEVLDKPALKAKCLEQVLKLDPENIAARQQLLYSYQEVSELERFKETLTPAEPQTLDDRLSSVSSSSPGLDDPLQGAVTPAAEREDPWQVAEKLSAEADASWQVAKTPPTDVGDISQGSETPSAELDDPWQVAETPSTKADDPWQVEPSSQTVASPPVAESTGTKKPKKKARPVQKPGKKRGRWLEITLIGVLVVTAFCVLGLFLLIPGRDAVQGGQASESEAPVEENPMAVVIDNIRASNAESVGHYMATIHSKSPSYQTTKQMTQEAFSMFDLSYKVSGLKIIKQSKNEVVVAFTLTTRKIRGPDFRDNRINGEMILRKEDGKWKIYDQVVHDVKYLN